MKKIFLIALFGLTACAMIPRLDPDKEYPDTGYVMRRVGDGRCWLTVNTDHYGVQETKLLDYEECRNYYPGMKVDVIISSGYVSRITKRAPI